MGYWLESFRFSETAFLFLLTLAGAHSTSLDTATAVLRAVIVLLVWYFTFSLNDLFDFRMDLWQGRENLLTLGRISPHNFLISSVLAAMFSVVLSVFLKFPVVPVILALVLGFTYSFPPFRAKRYGLRPVYVGLGCALSFLFGATALSEKVIQYALFLFSSITLLSVTRDFKDCEQDKKFKILTFYTLLGKDIGKKASVPLIIAGFLVSCPFSGLFLPLALGLASSILFLLTENYRIVMFLAGVLYLHVFLLFF